MGSQSSLVLIRGVDRLIQKYCVGVRKRARSALDSLERSKSFRAAQKLTLVSQVLRAPPLDPKSTQRAINRKNLLKTSNRHRMVIVVNVSGIAKVITKREK